MGAVRKLIRRTAEIVLPRVVTPKTGTVLMTVGLRYAHYRNFRESRARSATLDFVGRYGLRVLHGPFTGLAIPERIALRRYSIPKLLGCYEQELHSILCARIKDASYKRVVDIGSAEGYYAAGLARAMSRPVYAYEVNPFERRSTAMMAAVNGVGEKVITRGFCSAEELIQLCTDRSLILSDCEGFESALFAPELARALHHSDVLIECHKSPDWAPGGCPDTVRTAVETRELLASRFSETHDQLLIACTARKAADYPELVDIGLARDELVDEGRNDGRNDQEWLFLTARNPRRAAPNA